MKWISLFIVLLASLSIFSQNETSGFKAVEEIIFRNTGLSYNTETGKLIVPTVGKARNGCSVEDKPKRYECAVYRGQAKTFITQKDKSDDFNVAVLDRQVKTDDSLVAVSSFIRNGKVIQQSQCFYDGQMTAGSSQRKNHYTVSRMECYVVTPQLCKMLMGIETMEEFKSKEVFDSFKKILTSSQYKKSLIEAHKFNFRQAYLSMNIGHNYDYYSKLKKGFYNKDKQGQVKALSVVNFENSLLVRNSTSLYEVFTKANTLMGRVFDKPCKQLTQNNLIEGSTVEYVDKLETKVASSTKNK